MTDSKTPDWATEEAARAIDGTMAQSSPLFIQRVSQALLSAYERGRKEGIEEAAKVAEERDPHWPDEGDHIARSIRQLLEVKG